MRIRRTPDGRNSLYRLLSPFWWATQSTLHSDLADIDTFGIDGRCGGICCHRDSPPLAPSISLQDTFNSTDYRHGRGPLRPSSLHLPYRLCVHGDLRYRMYDTGSAQHLKLTSRHLPGSGPHHPFLVRLIHFRVLRSRQVG